MAPESIDWAHARHWARHNGVDLTDDMSRADQTRAINAARLAVDLCPWIMRDGRIGPEKLPPPSLGGGCSNKPNPQRANARARAYRAKKRAAAAGAS